MRPRRTASMMTSSAIHHPRLGIIGIAGCFVEGGADWTFNSSKHQLSVLATRNPLSFPLLAGVSRNRLADRRLGG